MAAANILQPGFREMGFTNQPRSGRVGAKVSGTCSFGVSTPMLMSRSDMVRMAMTTAKSLIKYRTQVGKKEEFRNSLKM